MNNNEFVDLLANVPKKIKKISFHNRDYSLSKEEIIYLYEQGKKDRDKEILKLCDKDYLLEQGINYDCPVCKLLKKELGK